MNKKPLISILTPVYNQAPYIEQTIQSVLNQTYQNWEWVILNDGSTDATEEIIKGFKDSRIRYSFQEHAGIAALTHTFNKALAMCNGGFIATLDGDDYWTSNKLDLQINALKDSESILSYGEAWLINRNGKKISYINIPKNAGIAHNAPAGSALKKLLEERACFIINSTVMYKKKALLNIGGFIEGKGLAQDYTSWVRLSIEGKFAPIPACLGYYRKHSHSLTQRIEPTAWFDNETNFLLEFALQNSQKLHALGIYYDEETLRKNWEEMKKYIPYNKAMYMLMNGFFDEAKAEFKIFLDKMPSLKHRFMHLMFIVSALMKYDIVNPATNLKIELTRLLRTKRGEPKKCV